MITQKIMGSDMVNMNRGFTLIELMIVVAVIGILGTLVYPSYLDHINTSRRAEAISALVILASDQERFYTANNAYATTLGQLGSTGFSESNYYTLLVAGDGVGFALTAAPNDWGDNLCGSFFLDSLGRRGVTGNPDEDGVVGSVGPPIVIDAEDVAICWR